MSGPPAAAMPPRRTLPKAPPYLVVLGGGDGLQVLTGNADHLLTVFQVHGAHASLQKEG